MAAQQALDAVSRVFATEAGQWPISEWPRQYWRLLLAAPALRQPVSGLPGSSLHGIARLPADQRAAVHQLTGLVGRALAAIFAQHQDLGIRNRLADRIGPPIDLAGWQIG